LVGWGDATSNQGLLFLWFDVEGRFLSVEPFILSEAERDSGEDYHDRYIRHFLERGRELGVRSGPIRVRHFYLGEPFLMAIRLLPEAALECLCDPHSSLSDFEDIAQEVQEVKDGVASGQFNLFWDEEWFGFNAEGRQGDWAPTAKWVEPERLYPLRTGGEAGGKAAYDTGRLPDGSQVLMGPYDDQEVLLVRFDAAGNLAEELSRPLAPGQVTKELALAWQRELGWQPGPIQVQKFMLAGHHVYVAEGPREVIIARYDPYYYPEAEVRQQLLNDLAEWEAAGNFVLWWGFQDYYLGPDGQVLPD
jgi:hypothetical protein